MTTCDFLIIGGGIIGISIAREIKARHPDCKILLLEKENQCGLHVKPVQTIFSRNRGISCVITVPKGFLAARLPAEKRFVY
jgi:heterodisulfide reductase subunit A-like polyferredoxin